MRDIFTEITNKNPEAFQALIRDKKALTYFWAGWCGPCLMMNAQFRASNEFEKFLAEHTDMNRYAINIEACGEIAKQYKIRDIPATIIFRDNKQVYNQVGCKELSKMIPEMRRALR